MRAPAPKPAIGRGEGASGGCQGSSSGGTPRPPPSHFASRAEPLLTCRSQPPAARAPPPAPPAPAPPPAPPAGGLRVTRARGGHNMAAAPGLLLWLLLLGPLRWVPGQPDPSPGRRFSDLKVCADDECSSECGAAGREAGSRVAAMAERVGAPRLAPGLGGGGVSGPRSPRPYAQLGDPPGGPAVGAAPATCCRDLLQAALTWLGGRRRPSRVSRGHLSVSRPRISAWAPGVMGWPAPAPWAPRAAAKSVPTPAAGDLGPRKTETHALRDLGRNLSG